MIRVCITTYNRNDMVAELVEHLSREECDIHVYDDGSPVPFKSDLATVYRYEQNAGRDFWYLRVKDLFDDAVHDPDWEYMFWTPDDLLPYEPKVLSRMRRLFERIRKDDPGIICLNPLKLAHHPCVQWVNFDPVERTFGPYTVNQTNWMDCCGFGSRNFARIAYSALRRFKPVVHKRLGTGVGRVISLNAHWLDKSMYQTTETWFKHGPHKSVMLPDMEKPVC